MITSILFKVCNIEHELVYKPAMGLSRGTSGEGHDILLPLSVNISSAEISLNLFEVSSKSNFSSSGDEVAMILAGDLSLKLKSCY